VDDEKAADQCDSRISEEANSGDAADLHMEPATTDKFNTNTEKRV
jgi:hypothetical protein